MKNIIGLFTECGYQISDISTTKLDIGRTELKIQDLEIHPDLLKFIQSLPNSEEYQYIFIARPSENIKNPRIENTEIAKLFMDSLEESFQAVKTPLLQTISAKESLLKDTSEKVRTLEHNLISTEQKVLGQSIEIQDSNTKFRIWR